MSRSGDRQWRRVIISIASALVFSVVALGASAFMFTQTLELQEKIAAVDQIGGICGPAGEPGADGLDGADGACGPIGAAGPCGPQGEPGVDGQDGATGAQGEPGADGSDGQDGATGAQGEPGADGEDGSDGQDGATGAQGEPGADGEDGSDGQDGATGAQGPAGQDGADGITTLGHWGSFFDTQDQLNPVAEPRAMRLNSADPSNCGVSVETTESGSQIFVTRSGAYNLQFSAQIRSNANQTKPVDIWLAKNGLAIPSTNTQFFAPDRKGIYIAAWNFVVHLESGDYLELMWYSADTSVYLSQLPEQTELGIPAVPSLILTLNQIG